MAPRLTSGVGESYAHAGSSQCSHSGRGDVRYLYQVLDAAAGGRVRPSKRSTYLDRATIRRPQPHVAAATTVLIAFERHRPSSRSRPNTLHTVRAALAALSGGDVALIRGRRAARACPRAAQRRRGGAPLCGAQSIDSQRSHGGRLRRYGLGYAQSRAPLSGTESVDSHRPHGGRLRRHGLGYVQSRAPLGGAETIEELSGRGRSVPARH